LLVCAVLACLQIGLARHVDPHPKMPNFPLSRTEAGDIAAYIASLR